MPADQARNRLYGLVRDFATQTPDYAAALRYFTKPDEWYDLTQVSSRVYGRRTEALVIQAAAGLDSPEQALTERLLVLPTETQLRALKLKAGYAANEI